MRFTTEQENAEDAVRIADAFADQTVRYLSLRQEELHQARQTNVLEDVQQLEAEIRELDQQIADQLAELNANRAPGAPFAEADSITRARRDAAVREYSTAYEAYRSLVAEDAGTLNLTTLERAQPVQVQTGGFTPPRTRSTRVPIGAGIGALLGAGVALLAERLDAKIRDRRKAEEAFGASVVAELPTLTRKQRAARLVVGPEEHHAAAEAFRSLRTSITFMAAGGQPLADDDRVGAILVTSPGPAEGKTTIAVNLAAAFAETGRSVVIVNADFRRPLASKILTDERPPLPAGLDGIDRLDPSEFLIPTKIPGVALLDLSPLGGTPGDLTRATVRLVTALADRVDVLVIDTPPLVVTTEALEFVPASKVVLLIGRIGRTATTAAERAGELARFGGAEQVAVALNDTGSMRLRRTTYYDYYGGRRGKGRETAGGATAGAGDRRGDRLTASPATTSGRRSTSSSSVATATADRGGDRRSVDQRAHAMTSASAVYRLNRANVVAWSGLAAIAVVLRRAHPRRRGVAVRRVDGAHPGAGAARRRHRRHRRRHPARRCSRSRR